MKKRFNQTLDALAKHWVLTIVGAMVAVVALGIVMGIGQSVWFDEGYSIILAQRPIHELIDLTKIDAHPPLYYLYLKLWASVFGWTDLSLRLSSILPSAAAIGIMAVIVRRLFSAKAMVIALPFMIFAPFLVRYSYEIRMYAPTMLLAAAGTYAIIVAKSSGSVKWWLAYTAIVALGMYTLYMSLVIWIGHAVWLLYEDLSRKKNPFLQKQWIFYTLAIALFVPWIPSVVYQVQHSALPPYSGALDIPTFGNVLTMIIACTPLSSNLPITMASLVLVALLVWTLICVWRRGTSKDWRPLMIFLVIFVTASVCYVIFSLPLNVLQFVERYMVHVSLFFYALIGVTVAVAYRLRLKSLASALAVAGLVLFVYGLYALWTQGNFNFQRWQPSNSQQVRVAIGCDKDTQIVAAGAYGYIDMWYAFQGCNFTYFQPLELNYVGGFAPVNAYNTTKRVKLTTDITTARVAFISYDDSTDIMEIDDRYEIEKRLEYPGVHVAIYRKAS